MPKKPTKPQSDSNGVSARLPTGLAERFSRFMQSTGLSKSEVLQVFIEIGLGACEEDPDLLMNTHFKLERERKAPKK